MALPRQIVQTSTAASNPVSLNSNVTPANTVVSCSVTGSPTYTVQWAYQDLNYAPNAFHAYSDVAPTIVWVDDPVVAGIAIAGIATNTLPATGVRINKTGGSGTVTANIVQAGVAGP